MIKITIKSNEIFIIFILGDYDSQKGGAPARTYSNEAALSLRSRRSGTKFTNPAFLRVCSLSADVFQGASFGIRPCLRWLVGSSTEKANVTVMKST